MNGGGKDEKAKRITWNNVWKKGQMSTDNLAPFSIPSYISISSSSVDTKVSESTKNISVWYPNNRTTAFPSIQVDLLLVPSDMNPFFTYSISFEFQINLPFGWNQVEWRGNQ